MTVKAVVRGYRLPRGARALTRSATWKVFERKVFRPIYLFNVRGTSNNGKLTKGAVASMRSVEHARSLPKFCIFPVRVGYCCSIWACTPDVKQEGKFGRIVRKLIGKATVLKKEFSHIRTVKVLHATLHFLIRLVAILICLFWVS